MLSQAPIPKFTLAQRIKLISLGIFSWDIPTYTTSNELLKLYELSKTLKKQSTLVEIGSYIGASSLMLAKGIEKSSTIYCIDTWRNDAMTEGNWDTFSEFMKNTSSFKDNIVTIKSNSIEAGLLFDKAIDFIFIDGDHSYQAVQADVIMWFPKLKSNGIVVMHDYEWADGVKKVIDEDIKPHLLSYDSLPNMFWGWKK